MPEKRSIGSSFYNPFCGATIEANICHAIENSMVCNSWGQSISARYSETKEDNSKTERRAKVIFVDKDGAPIGY
jgi:hypothetical protein